MIDISKESKKWYITILNFCIRTILFAILVGTAVFIYSKLFNSFIEARYLYRFLIFLVLWIFTAYITLPRIHRKLTKLYLPNYFFGRVQTIDGLLGDTVNLAINGKRAKVIQAMKEAGWTEAESLTIKSSFKLWNASLRSKSYPDAPVSPLYLFGRKQDIAFEKEVNGNPRKRHHVRLWKTPKDWWLPGGYKADWIGAAAFDENIRLSLFTGQITHRIDADIDKERDFVIQSLEATKVFDKIEIIENYMSGFYGRNGGGDIMLTDGALPFVYLK
jgi:hypothetical protein